MCLLGVRNSPLLAAPHSSNLPRTETENCHHHVPSVRSKLNTVSGKQISLFKQSLGRIGQECDCGDSRETGGNNDVCVWGECRESDTNTMCITVR